MPAIRATSSAGGAHLYTENSGASALTAERLWTREHVFDAASAMTVSMSAISGDCEELRVGQTR